MDARPLSERRNARPKLRDSEAFHLGNPLRIDRLHQLEQPQIERQIGHVNDPLVPAEYKARRKEQAARRAVPGDAIEVAKLGDGLAGRVDDDDLVRLVRRHPDVVVLVDGEPISTVDAVHEDYRRPGASAAHRNPDDLIVAGIRNKQSSSSLVELETIGAEW